MRAPGYMIGMGALLVSGLLGLALLSMRGTERGQPSETGRLATAISSSDALSERSEWASAQSASGLPNIPLRTQDGRKVRFYDAEKISHTGLVTFGNDKTGRWAALPAGLDSKDLAQAILRVTRPMDGH